MSSDGTTLHQIKKAASIMNGVALGIHDVPNGSAQSALDDLEEEIDQLVIIAEKFGCSPDDITLAKVVSSTSDGAATQSRLNKLLEEKINAGGSNELRKIIQKRCAMHLEDNLRLAEISGIEHFYIQVQLTLTIKAV